MNVYKLEAAIGLNSTEYQKGLKAAGENMSAMGDKIKAGAAAIGKATAAGLSAGAAGVAALTKQAVAAYADYEQLTGGVEKLFGESSDLLMAYAKDAANTAGMSVNAYMETATSFAAALTTSVQAAGGSMDEAVEYADTAMRDMSDNANTFGTDIASIQTAYQGFAKQNYTMLDNLKLGYGGTKAEMERLIEDANKLRREQGINNDLTIESYADIITAIHTVQTQMKITGTTARESSKTISGSIGAVKAAWTNLTIEMAKEDGDISGAFEALGDNVGAVIDNMLPRVEQAIGGIGEFIASAAPQVTSGLRKLLPRVLPSLVSTAGTLISTVGSAVMQSIPDLLTMSGGLLDGFVNNSQYIFASAQQLMSNLADQIVNVDYGKLGSSLSTIFINAVNSVTDFLKGIDYAKVGADIANFINGIDWKGVIDAVINGVAAVLKATPSILSGFFKGVDFTDMSTALALAFTPKMITSLGSTIGNSSFSEVETALGGKFGGLGDSSGLSFFNKFSACVQAALIGWNIGSLIYKAFEDDIDAAIGGIMDKFSTAFGGDATIYEDTDLINNWDEAFQNDAHLPTEIPELDTFQPSSLPAVADKLAQQQVLAAVANMQPTFAETAKSKIGKLRNSFKLRAGGGMVRSPEFSLVGEAGTEAVIPLKNDADGIKQIANQLSRNINGNGTINNYFTVNANISSENDLKDLAGRLIKYVSEGLRAEQVSSDRALGGVSW